MIITITTDFGDLDGFGGIMKGVMAGIAPPVQFVDVSNQIAPGDIAGGAWVLGNAFAYFPAGTIHLAVVDPGVGSTRRGVIVRSKKYTFVGPDNGLFTYVLQDIGAVDCFSIDRPSYWRENVSSTFHGRDIFAPVCAHLAAGVEPKKLGSPIGFSELIRLPLPEFEVKGATVDGVVVYVDRFGNLITNIPVSALVSARSARMGEVRIPVGETYSSVEPGRPLALPGSHGYLEIGINQGNAAKELNAAVGAPVVLKLDG
jgi:S-adenosyl-L-methionine hydrolase (adenosine-forming)